MKREYLEGLGLEKEVIDKIMVENGKDIENAKKEVTNLEESIDTLKVEKANLEGQLKTANKEIEGFKDLDIDEIKKKADKYKEDFEVLEKQSKEELENLKYEYKLTEFANKYEFASDRVKKSIIEDLKEKDFKLIDDELVGAKEYIEKLKEDEPNSFMVEEEEQLPKFVLPGSKNKDNTEVMTRDEFLKLSYTERTELKKDNEKLYNKIMK